VRKGEREKGRKMYGCMGLRGLLVISCWELGKQLRMKRVKDRNKIKGLKDGQERTMGSV
jgi:hypothetical protein